MHGETRRQFLAELKAKKAEYAQRKREEKEHDKDREPWSFRMTVLHPRHPTVDFGAGTAQQFRVRDESLDEDEVFGFYNENPKTSAPGPASYDVGIRGTREPSSGTRRSYSAA